MTHNQDIIHRTQVAADHLRLEADRGTAIVNRLLVLESTRLRNGTLTARQAADWAELVKQAEQVRTFDLRRVMLAGVTPHVHDASAEDREVNP